MKGTESNPLPRRWHWLVQAFRWYAERYVRKHFHAVRLSRSGVAPPASDGPLIIVLNHPAWWDPLIGIVLSRQFPDHEHVAAMDAAALRAYPFFSRLGFVPVDNSGRGAARFLAAGHAVLGDASRAYWVTPQGRFADVRERPLGLKPGIGYLAVRNPHAIILPVALEYAFWSESTPEALIRFGESIRVSDQPGRNGREWTSFIEETMMRNMDALAIEAAARNAELFRTVLEGRSGIGGVYDIWRRVKAWARGRRFDPSHTAEARP